MCAHVFRTILPNIDPDLGLWFESWVCPEVWVGSPPASLPPESRCLVLGFLDKVFPGMASLAHHCLPEGLPMIP